MSVNPARLLDLGLRPYREVWAIQRAVHERVAAGEEPDTWIVVEHPPVVTLGRNAKRENVLLSEAQLSARGIDLVEVERGGDVTYHGPGQLVVYPIRRLERFREVSPLVRALEGALILACHKFGITAERWSEHAGLWVGFNQICAIGMAVRKMTSLHGLALNVSTELDYDRVITPCGLSDRGITSLSREADRPISVEEAKPAVLAALSDTFHVRFERQSIEQS